VVFVKFLPMGVAVKWSESFLNRIFNCVAFSAAFHLIYKTLKDYYV